MRFRNYFLFILLFCSFSALYGQQSFHEVEAVPGEGAYTLLRRHGLEPAVYLQSFIALNQEQLGAGNSLQLGKTYRLPVAKNPGAALQPDSLIQAAPDTIHFAMADVAVSASASEAAVPEAEMVKISKAGTPPLKQEAATTVLSVPLFGPAYEKVVVKDQQLKGAVYYLLSGHGGPDPGAVGKYGTYSLSEDEYAYDVTLRLARRLMEHGAMVYMIIKDEDDGIRDENILLYDNDEICHPDLAIPYNQNERLRQRTQAVNALYLKHKGAYQRMLAIHVDSRNRGQNVDVFFYHHENSPSGKRLADHIHQTISSKYSRYQPNRDYFGNVSTRSSLFVVKYSHPPAVFVELGNIRNDRDQRRFVLPDNRQALANWMVEGILADYKAE